MRIQNISDFQACQSITPKNVLSLGKLGPDWKDMDFCVTYTFLIIWNCYVIFPLSRIPDLFGKTFRERKIISVIIISCASVHVQFL